MTRTVLKITYGKNVSKICTDIHIGTNETRDCPAFPCPENCTLSEWTNWSSCAKIDCGIGKRNRTRRLSFPAAYRNNGNRSIINKTLEERNCYGVYRECQRDCDWGTWSEWSNCSLCPKKWESKLTKKRSRIIISKSTPFGNCDHNLLNQTEDCSKQIPCSELALISIEKADKNSAVTIAATVCAAVLVVMTAISVLIFFRNRQSKIIHKSAENIQTTVEQSYTYESFSVLISTPIKPVKAKSKVGKIITGSKFKKPASVKSRSKNLPDSQKSNTKSTSGKSAKNMN